MVSVQLGDGLRVVLAQLGHTILCLRHQLLLLGHHIFLLGCKGGPEVSDLLLEIGNLLFQLVGDELRLARGIISKFLKHLLVTGFRRLHLLSVLIIQGLLHLFEVGGRLHSVGFEVLCELADLVTKSLSLGITRLHGVRELRLQVSNLGLESGDLRALLEDGAVAFHDVV